MAALTTAQLEILKLFQYDIPEQNLLEIKDIIAQYLATNLISSANSDWETKGLSNTDMNKWKDEHLRVKTL